MRALFTTLKILTGLAVFIAVASYPAAWILASSAVEVQQIRAYDDALVAFNQWQFEDDDWDESVVAIYGSAEGEPVEVLFVDEERLLRPSEDESIVLLPKNAGDNFFQVKTIFFFAQIALAAAALAALLGAAGVWLVGRRVRSTSSSVAGADAVSA